MKKQTAVEWLTIQVVNFPTMENLRNNIEKLVEKSLEMEKQQIIDAFEQGEYTGRGFEDVTSEEYYNINFEPK
jgi:hypothetical protein